MTKKYQIGLLVIIIIVFLYFLLGFKSSDTVAPSSDKQTEQEEIVIGKKNIEEKNFTGNKAVISGNTLLATAAQEYVDEAILEFKKSADLDVPDMREKFGEDAPMANYTIEMDAKLKVGLKTQSIIISMYAYTGGANGNSSYRVFTADKTNGKILILADLVPKGERDEFVSMVKKELLAWRPERAEGLVVFEEDVKNLNFENFIDWSLDTENLNLYFDKYEVAPGALGAIEFPIPLEKVSNFLVP